MDPDQSSAASTAGKADPAAAADSTAAPSASAGGIGNLPEGDAGCRPALPPRTSTLSVPGPKLPPRKGPESSPALPPRRPSETPSQPDSRLGRRDSNETISSIASAGSSLSGTSRATSITSARSVKAPTYDPSSLPALPPKRTEEEKQAVKEAYYQTGSKPTSRFPLKSRLSSPSIQSKQNGTTAPPPPRPSAQQATPPLPSHKGSGAEPAPRNIDPPPDPVGRPPPAQPPRPRQNPLTMGFGNPSQPSSPPPVPSIRPSSTAQTNGMPPPVPTSSRPDLAALQASKPKMNAAMTAVSTGSQGSCLRCRDFSAPDQHAARFPRQTVPNQDVGWLATQLCAPFDSQTDKARTIFTWLHHNIFYDTHAFFSGNLKPSSPQSTLASGWAVCEGYAGLFAALAMKAGLEAIVIGGNGKGYGYEQLKPGEPIPPYSGGHAWNAVKLDDGRWKLIDACWGAGHICGANNLYKQEFSPERFTQSNEEFGLDHFPEDSSKQYRSDGRIVTWEEYITGNKHGCGADFFSGYIGPEGISEHSFKPSKNPIVISEQGPMVRFSFQKICPHWDPIKNGKGPHCLYTLAIDNLEGTPKNHMPFDTNGQVWWCDVPVQDLGRPGQSVKVLAVTKFRNRDGRGVTIQEYKEWKGKCALSWQFVAKWELA
ncbi:hypothetical protein M433DRAFT_136632 [Acidomyces richmondensis BFW]|nr:hypothetical protein M433DRAFT_136632 [Acidomyces richmondensis BFW]